MGNVLVAIKRFVMNKNTVTIIGVIVAMVLLYSVYNSKIKEAVAPIKIPVAKTTIQPRTLITDDMVELISVPAVAVSKDVIRNKGLIVGKYSNVNTVIPQGSMFYGQVVISKDDLPDSAFLDIKENEIPYAFPVTMTSTYGNSMFPGTKIDIYMKAEDDEQEDKVMFGKLIENVEILAVKDSSGKNVFESTAENRTPSLIIFGVTEEIHTLLRKASYMGNYGVVLIPVPHGTNINTEGGVVVSTEHLRTFINAKTIVIPDAVPETTPEVTPEENPGA